MKVERYKLVVCVGTGGVGKTTIAAALAYRAARQGRRALVLTIDPARALARALGLAELGGEPVQVVPDAPFFAAMLDAKRAWDAFITRHAPSAEVAASLLANPFYQRLSTSFAGSTEYMAVEEMCRHVESSRYDLIVLDTPPSAHALDFLTAPARIDRLLALDPGLAWKSTGFAARYLAHRLESATSSKTLRDIAAFAAAFHALVDATLARTRRARGLLASGDAAFVLVAAPRQLVIEETSVLRRKLAAQPTPLAGVVVNRVHAVPDVDPAHVAALGDDPPGRWLHAVWTDAVAEVTDERAALQSFSLGVPSVHVREADHDLHTLADLDHVIDALDAE